MLRPSNAPAGAQMGSSSGVLVLVVVMFVSAIPAQIGADPNAHPREVASALAGSVFAVDSSAKLLYGIDGTAALLTGESQSAIVMATSLPGEDGTALQSAPLGVAAPRSYGVDQVALYVSFADGTVRGYNQSLGVVRQGQLGSPASSLEWFDLGYDLAHPAGLLLWVTGTDGVVHLSDAQSFAAVGTLRPSFSDGTLPGTLSGVASHEGAILVEVGGAALYRLATTSVSGPLPGNGTIVAGGPLPYGLPGSGIGSFGPSLGFVSDGRLFLLEQTSAYCSFEWSLTYPDDYWSPPYAWAVTQSSSAPQGLTARSWNGPVDVGRGYVAMVDTRSVSEIQYQAATLAAGVNEHRMEVVVSPDSYLTGTLPLTVGYGLSANPLTGRDTEVTFLPDSTQHISPQVGTDYDMSTYVTSNTSWRTFSPSAQPRFLNMGSLSRGDWGTGEVLGPSVRVDHDLLVSPRGAFVDNTAWKTPDLEHRSFQLPTGMAGRVEMTLADPRGSSGGLQPSGGLLPTSDYCPGSVPSPVADSLNLQLGSIEAWQTTRSGLLVAGKGTIVRVGVTLSGATILDDVQVKVTLGQETRTLRRTLVVWGPSTYVLDERQLRQYLPLREDAIGNGDDSDLRAFLADEVRYRGADAYNVGNGSPFHPDVGDALPLTVEIDPLDERTETFETDNVGTTTLSTWERSGTFTLRFREAFRSDWPLDPSIALADISGAHAAYFRSVMPLPEKEVIVLPSPPALDIGTTTWFFSDGSRFDGAVLADIEEYDRTEPDRKVWIVPRGSIGGDATMGAQFSSEPNAVFVSQIAPDSTSAHEIGHTYGVTDEYAREGNFWDSATYPYGTLAADGWDTYGWKVHKPAKISQAPFDLRQWTTNETGNYYSMWGSKAYIPQDLGVLHRWGLWPGNPATHGSDWNSQWMTDSNYGLLTTALLQPGAPPPPQAQIPLLLIVGRLYDNGTLVAIPLGVSQGTPQNVPFGDVTVTLLDSTGTYLNTSYGMLEGSPEEAALQPYRSFALQVPWQAEVQSLTVSAGFAMPVLINRSAAPSVSLAAALNGTAVDVTWNSTDGNDSVVRVSLQVSADGGQSWQAAALGQPANGSYTIPLFGFPAGSYLVGATASDGTGSAQDTAGPFDVADHGPTVAIIEPEADLTVSLGAEVSLAAFATDADTAVSQEEIAWSSDLQGALGSGHLLVLSTLGVGTHRIEARYSDPSELLGSDVVNVTVLARPAVDAALESVETDVTTADLGETIHLSGSVSVSGGSALIRASLFLGDPSAGGTQIQPFEPVFASPGTPSTLATNLTVRTAGTQVLWVVLEHADEDPDPDNEARSLTISVQLPAPPPVDHPPSAHIGASPQHARTNETIHFSAQGSSDPDGTVLTYTWDLGDGTTSVRRDEDHAYALPGEYLVYLTVTDGNLSSASTSLQVDVGNRPPVVSVQVPTSLVAGTAYDFNASASDPDGTVVEIRWEFGDGQSGIGPSVRHSYADDGNFTINVTATDDRGERAMVSTPVRVTPTTDDGPGPGPGPGPAPGPDPGRDGPVRGLPAVQLYAIIAGIALAVVVALILLRPRRPQADTPPPQQKPPTPKPLEAMPSPATEKRTDASGLTGPEQGPQQ